MVNKQIINIIIFIIIVKIDNYNIKEDIKVIQVIYLLKYNKEFFNVVKEVSIIGKGIITEIIFILIVYQSGK